MANQNTNPNSDNNSTSTSGEDVTFDSIVDIDVAELNDNQKAFILDNSGELTEEQREMYAEVLEGADNSEDEDEDEDTEINPEDIEIKTRSKKTEEKKVESEGEDDDDTEIDPEEAKTIGKVVDKKLGDYRGTQSEIQAIKDKQDVNDFISDNPDFKPYRDVMLKYMAHPAYKDIPVENLSLIVAGSDLQKLGAKKEREAASKAKSTQDGGQTVRDRKGGGEDDWAKVSREAFEKKKNEVLGIKV